MNNSYKGNIVAWFAQNPVAANLLMILVIVLGVTSMRTLRKEAFPSLKPDSITISVSYNSGSAKESEEGLAIKIEDRLEDVTGIKTITSTSTGSGVTVTVEERSGYNLNTLLRDVKAKVDAISTFPVDAKKPVIQEAERQEHAIWLQLYGDVGRHTLQQVADSLKSDLLASPKISQVSESGRLAPMMVIEISEGQLEAYGLSLKDVENAINNNSSSPMTAVMSNKHLYLQLKASKQAYLKQDFAQIPLLTTANGQQILLGDVAHIMDTFDNDTAVLSRFQGHDSIALQVITTGQDDIADSVAAAKKVVKTWHDDGKLPAGVKLATWYDRSQHIKERLQLMVKNASSGLLVVFVLLALFLNLTVAFWVAMGLPFIFFGTLFFMGDKFLGLSLNEFTTFGFILALGIVVDDAIVIGESIYSVRSNEGDTMASTIKGTMLVAIPTLFGVFTTVAAFFSLSQIQGRLGQVYAQFAEVVTLCLILSLIESKLILPAHLAHLKTHRTHQGPWLSRAWQSIQHATDLGMQWFTQRCYRPVIHLAVHYRYAVTLLFVAIFLLVIAMPMTGVIRISFFPSIPGDTVHAQLTMQKDVSFGLTHHVLRTLESDAYQIDKNLRKKTHYKNSAIANLQVLSEADQTGTVTVELKADAPYDSKTFSKAWRKMAGIPEGVKTLSIQSSRHMTDALRIELRDNDDAILQAAGTRLKKALSGIPAVSGIDDNLSPEQPQLHLKLTRQGKAMGLTTDDLAIQILQAFRGQVVQRFQRNNDELEVRVRYPAKDRQNANDVLDAKIRTPDGKVVPLSSVAKVRYGYTRDKITRINRKRAVFLSADVDKQQLSATDLVSQLKAKVIPEIERDYPGLKVHFAGEAEEQAETQSSMITMFMLAMLVIYILLAVPLSSYIQPVLIMTAIPFGIVGAVLGHWLNHLPLSILSLNGIIALSGVAVNDSLLLVSRFNELKKEISDTKQAIIETCTGRLRAVLLTSFTTYGGLAPLINETSHQAQFLIPAAVSLGYGIMFATLITLILIPSLLMIQLDISCLLNKTKKTLFPSMEEQQSC